MTQANLVFTVPEIEKELKRIEHSTSVTVFMLFKPKFVIENMGKTAAENLSIKIDGKMPGQDWQSAFRSNSQITLAGGQGSTVLFELELPFNIDFPKQINFKMTLNWQDIHSKELSKTINAKWTSNDNFWSYDSGE